jgi:NAD(P)-dependent dehydrogenase (short-subunit alcohol dehydrogenase family)
MKLEGCTAAITGAGSGIGRAIAVQLAAKGCSLALGDIDQPGLAETVELAAGASDVIGVVTDVTDRASVQTFADASVDRFGGVDLLVNNAGVSTFNLLEDQTLADWRWVVEVNLMGVVNGIDAFLPVLIGREQAHVVNVASIAGIQSGIAFIGPYSASKVAVVSISETLAQEMAATHPNVGVTVLCPGNTDTRVMDAERNRPTDMGREQRSADAETWRSAIQESFTGPTGLSPDAVAEQLIAGVEEGRLFVLTHPDMAPLLTDRLDRVKAAVESEAARAR